MIRSLSNVFCEENFKRREYSSLRVLYHTHRRIGFCEGIDMARATNSSFFKGVSAVALAALFLAGCVKPNIPQSTAFPDIRLEPVTATVFVDANGTLYPTSWPSEVERSQLRERKSLLNALDPVGRDRIAAAEQEQLAELHRLSEQSGRVFIFVHGYNNSEAMAARSFDELERRIAFSEDDVLIRFHWDGLIGKGLVRSGQAWFPAAGYSQMAGSRGLRRVLSGFRDEDVVVVTHSRGASVVLSALGNPPFDPEFYEATVALEFAKKQGERFLRPEELEETGEGSISVAMLAPAVGFPDFWAVSCESREEGEWCGSPMVTATTRCPNYRGFNSNLTRIAYSTNSNDRILGKLIHPFASKFNATNLGVDRSVGDALGKCYDFPINAVPFENTNGHGFFDYLADPALETLMESVGVDLAQ